MTDDTLKALRALIEDGRRWQKVIAKLTAALEAQADQIARLKAENATLREAVNKAAGWFEECAKSHRARGQLQDYADHLEGRVATLEAENAKLREALGPLIEIARPMRCGP